MANVHKTKRTSAKVVLNRNFAMYSFVLPLFFMKYTEGNIDIGYDQNIAAITGLK